ncbi:MAG: VWA domain-containing protein [Bryobacteraceae bacterium]|jgi:VWFA-related protein
MPAIGRQALAVLCCAQVIAQQSPPPPDSRSDVVFSVTTSLVQVDAVVTDAKGHYITDLSANDFQVLEDGKPQKITNFSYIRTGSKAAPSAPPATGPKSVAALPPPPSAPPRIEDVRRTMVLMVDDLGMSFESIAFVRYSLRKFVEKQMQPGDLVAVCRTAMGSGMLQQFTTDKRILLAAIDALHWNPYVPAVRDFAPSFSTASAPSVPGQTPVNQAGQSSGQTAEAFFSADKNPFLAVGALGAINYILRALWEMPGRKSLVLFSDGMALDAWHPEALEALRSVVDSANRAGTVIYTMHALGLATLMPNAQEHIGGAGGMSLDVAQKWAYGVVSGLHSDFNAGQQGLELIASQTGGLAYANGNDLNWGLDRVLEDQQGYYLIGYKPAAGTFDSRHGWRSYHKIKVKVTRAGLHVRSRTGFFGATDDETRPLYDTPLAQLHAAMVSPFQSAGVHLRLTALYAEVPKRGPVVRNLLHIDAHDLTFQQTPEGAALARMEILAVATGVDGRQLVQLAKTYEFRTPIDRLPEDLKNGALYTLDVPVQKRGAYQVHVAVRDEATGKFGSASQFLVVPDPKKDRVALTSVVLQQGDRPPGTQARAEMTPATRQFHPGEQLDYFCMVEKGRKNAPTQGLDAQIRIVRDGRDLYSGPAHLIPTANGLAIMGKLKLGGKIAPGDYYLEVIAADRAARKNGASAQWTDFEVLP